MSADTPLVDVRIAGLAPAGIQLDAEHADRYRYTFVLAPPAPDSLWTQTLVELASADIAAGDAGPPFVQTVEFDRLTAAFAAGADMQGQLDRLKALVARVNAAYRARYPEGSPELEAERAWRRAREEERQPARDAARGLRY